MNMCKYKHIVLTKSQFSWKQTEIIIINSQEFFSIIDIWEKLIHFSFPSFKYYNGETGKSIQKKYLIS